MKPRSWAAARKTERDFMVSSGMARSSSTNRGANLRHALGLMSGTSLDGIDVAALATDGVRQVAAGPALTVSYSEEFRERLLGVDVVGDFRSADIAAGGQGAPLAPLYHAALAASLAKPVAILNLGGVGNVTWIGEGEHAILAFDTGPGNALIDDWVRRHTGAAADIGGALARVGQVSAAHVAGFLEHPYFGRRPPKSLDRDDFRGAAPVGLSVADGTAT